MKPFFILFGATGDLAREKIYPALKEVHNLNVVGYGRNPSYKNRLDGFPYVVGDFDNPNNLLSYLNNKVKNKEVKNKDVKLFFYFALPPSLYIQAVKFVKENFKDFNTKIALEKPFGLSHLEARRIEKVLKKYNLKDFYLVDHYLAKDSIRKAFRKNIDLKSIKRIEMSILESSDVSKRGRFYDQVGVIKDVGQNHLINTIDYLFKLNSVSDFLKEIRYQKKSLFLGQYKGYKKVLGVSYNSKTPTYFKAEFKYKWIEILLRSGKALDKSQVIINLFDNQGNIKNIIKNNQKQIPYKAHKEVIRDFVCDEKKYAISIENSVQSWKVVEQIYKDITDIKLVLYPFGASIKKIERI